MKNLQLKKECFEMTKEEIINLIDNRIKSEYEKYKKTEWSKIAAHKIYDSLINLLSNKKQLCQNNNLKNKILL